MNENNVDGMDIYIRLKKNWIYQHFTLNDLFNKNEEELIFHYI